MHFTDRLFDAVQKKNSRVVVGLDPRPELLPAAIFNRYQVKSEGTLASVAGAVTEFNANVIEAVADIAVAVKCQSAFYECLGIEGLKAYSRTIQIAREHGLLVIGDVKRNDIGSTAEAYAEAHLGGGPSGFEGTSFQADAVTVNPWLGADGIMPFVERAALCDCGVFVLLRTSNPSSCQLQELVCNGRPVYRHLADLVREWGAKSVGDSGYSLVGAVAGATFPGQLSELRASMPHTPFLVPGYGAQGGGAEDVAGGFDSSGLGAVVNSSRGIIYSFRKEPYSARYGDAAYKDAVRAAAEDMRAELELTLKNR